jgi:putative transposase
VRKKALSERKHSCSCGCSLGRDEAAARVMLQWGLQELQNLETINTAGTVVGQAAA